MVGARTIHHDKSNDKLFWFLPAEDESGGLEGVLKNSTYDRKAGCKYKSEDSLTPTAWAAAALTPS